MHDSANPALAGTSVLARFFADPALEGRRFAVSAGDVLHEPDTNADKVYFLHRGQVRLYQVGQNDNSRLIEILGPDDWFGSAALAGQQTHGTRAVAVAQSVVTEVRADRLTAALSHNPLFAVEFTKQLAGKLLAAHEDAARLVFEDCNQRLIGTLLRFSRSAASTTREDGVVLRITHDQLAQAIGVARETVSLALTQLRHQKVLTTGRNQLTFNPEALRRFADGQGRNFVTNGHAEQHERVA